MAKRALEYGLNLRSPPKHCTNASHANLGRYYSQWPTVVILKNTSTPSLRKTTRGLHHIQTLHSLQSGQQLRDSQAEMPPINPHKRPDLHETPRAATRASWNKIQINFADKLERLTQLRAPRAWIGSTYSVHYTPLENPTVALTR